MRDVRETIKELIDSKIGPSELFDEPVSTLRTITWQLALRWRHTKDKESDYAEHIRTTLMQIREHIKATYPRIGKSVH